MDCIIIDDEAAARLILHKFCKKTKNLVVRKEFDNATEVLPFLEKHKIDLIFLDLHMPILSGYGFIDSLKTPPKIILTSTDHDLAIKAFEYQCIIDFLVKPFKFPRFLQALNKAQRAIQILNNHENAVTRDVNVEDLYVAFDNKLIRIDLDKILFIKTFGKGIQIHSQNKNYVINSSLTKISEKLPKHSFLKVHQSYVINVSKTKEIKKNIVFIYNESIPLSRLNKPELLKRINL